MNSGEHGHGPHDTHGPRLEAHAPSGRILERYHYRNGQPAEGFVQGKGCPVFLEHVPALLHAAGNH